MNLIFNKFLLSVFIMVLANNSSATQLENAKIEFDKGNYQEALRIYSSIIGENEYHDIALFNAGNSAFRLERLGEAIFYYSKALILKPRDPDIQFNLNFTRQKIKDKIENLSPIKSGLKEILFSVSVSEVIGSLIVTSCFIFLTTVLGLILRDRIWLLWVRNFSSGLFAIGLLWFLTRYSLEVPTGVVISQEASVYSGKGVNNVLLFTLHQGAEFSHNQTDHKWNHKSDNQTGHQNSENWTQIELSDGKKGWIENSNIIW